MRILSRHIGRSVFAAVSITLLVIVGLDGVAAIIDEADSIRRNYRFIDLLIYVATTLPSRIYEYIPLSCLVGCLFGLGQLANDSELIVIRAAGVSTLRIVAYVLRPALVFIFVGLLLGEYFAPYLDQLAKGQREYLRKGESAPDSSSGLWIKEGDEVMHFNAVFPGGVLFGVTRYQFSESRQLSEASFSSRATYNSVAGHWMEENVSITRFYPERTESDKLITRQWNSELSPQLLLVNVLPPSGLSISTLYYYIDFLQQQGTDAAIYKLAFWRKILQPLIIVGLVIIGIAFVFGPLRGSTMGLKIFIGVIVGIVFNIIQDMLGPSSIVMGFSPLAAVLTPVAVCLLIGAYLLRRGR